MVLLRFLPAPMTALAVIVGFLALISAPLTPVSQAAVSPHVTVDPTSSRTFHAHPGMTNTQASHRATAHSRTVKAKPAEPTEPSDVVEAGHAVPKTVTVSTLTTVTTQRPRTNSLLELSAGTGSLGNVPTGCNTAHGCVSGPATGGGASGGIVPVSYVNDAQDAPAAQNTAHPVGAPDNSENITDVDTNAGTADIVALGTGTGFEVPVADSDQSAGDPPPAGDDDLLWGPGHPDWDKRHVVA
jgi:hypothetical protein